MRCRETILLEQRGEITILTLNRPERANTLNGQLLAELYDATVEVSQDASIKALIVTGAGRHFCGGADLRSRNLNAADASGSAGGRRRMPHIRIGFEHVPQPVIAAINGAAMGGGCEIAIACDFRLIADGAQIGLTEIRFGALPRGGGTARLPRIVGLAHAKEMILVGEPISAQRAEHIGLVNRVVPAERLLDEAVEFAGILASRASYAMSTAKTLLDHSLEVDLASALAFERTLTATMGTPEARAKARADAAARSSTYARIFDNPDK
jgi:enoyl-CoA hydratase/carnithine racemase